MLVPLHTTLHPVKVFLCFPSFQFAPKSGHLQPLTSFRMPPGFLRLALGRSWDEFCGMLQRMTRILVTLQQWLIPLWWTLCLKIGRMLTFSLTSVWFSDTKLSCLKCFSTLSRNMTTTPACVNSLISRRRRVKRLHQAMIGCTVTKSMTGLVSLNSR